MKTHLRILVGVGALVLSGLTLFFFWRERSVPVSSEIVGVSTPSPRSGSSDISSQSKSVTSDEKDQEALPSEFSRSTPLEWSTHATGVKTRLATSDRVLALTLDACGGAGSDGYDEKLIQFLEDRHIPATLFVTMKWIDANPNTFQSLAKEPLFEMENHGTNHVPCSVSGRSAYGIVGERNANEVVNEIKTNAEHITSLTGRTPKFYRSGTAFTDEVCPQIAERLGEEVVNFSVLGDAGATYSAGQVEQALLGATPGSIIILHMNHPEKETAEGVIAAVPLLEKRGFRFVTLSQYPLR